MTSPGDDNLEEELRRALSEAASGVEPGSDGLDKIRARISGRPPRPWPISVLLGIVERARNWTWRGHWARPAWLSRLRPARLSRLREVRLSRLREVRLSRLREVRWPRLRRGNFPEQGTGSLRLAAVIAALAVIASIVLGVQPVRVAIFQAGSALHGGSGSRRAAAGTDGHEARAVPAGKGAPSPGAATPGDRRTGRGSTTPGAAKAPGTATHQAAAGKCVPSAPPAMAGAQPGLTNVGPSAAQPPAPVVSAKVPPAQPVYTDTSVTCPVASPAKPPTPTPTPTPSGGSSTSAPVSATAASAPTGTEPAPWSPTPTAGPSLSGDGGPGQSGPPFRSRQGRRQHGPWLQYGRGPWSGRDRWW